MVILSDNSHKISFHFVAVIFFFTQPEDKISDKSILKVHVFADDKI